MYTHLYLTSPSLCQTKLNSYVFLDTPPSGKMFHNLNMENNDHLGYFNSLLRKPKPLTRHFTSTSSPQHSLCTTPQVPKPRWWFRISVLSDSLWPHGLHSQLDPVEKPWFPQCRVQYHPPAGLSQYFPDKWSNSHNVDMTLRAHLAQFNITQRWWYSKSLWHYEHEKLDLKT